MKVCVYDILDDSASAEDLLPRLPQWRLQKALSYRSELDRFLCAKSFLMLEEMLRKQYGLEGCPEFSYGRYGKPYFKEYPDIFFNISHCRKGIACAVSEFPVGVDIEVIQSGKDLLDITLNAEEKAIVESSSEPDLKFTEFWTRKESLLKLTGEGLRDNLKDVLSETNNARIETAVNPDAGYVLSVATADAC